MKKPVSIIHFIVFVGLVVIQYSCDQKAKQGDCDEIPCDRSLLELVNFYEVDDLNFEVFNDSKAVNSTFYNKTYEAEYFLKQFYAPWNYEAATDTTLINSLWNEFFTYASGIAANSPCYTGNLRAYSEKYISEINSNLPRRSTGFLSLKEYGITTQTTDLKGLPTDEYCFKSIRNPGEGYPFDYLQYSTLWVGTPIAILERTVDNRWCFVQSTYGKGWVKSESIALPDRSQINKMIGSEKMVVVGDQILLNGKSSSYKVFTGTILSLDKNTQEILYPTKSPIDNKLVFDRIKGKSQMIKAFPVEFNEENVSSLLSQMIEGKYSWGGIDGGRDCSSTLKDYFSAFGIWLPRDSKDQRYSGQVVDIKAMTLEEKKDEIMENGIPFLSTLYLPGHIVLYVGTNEASEMLMYHTVWGLKTYHSQSMMNEILNSRERFGLYGLRERDNDQVETRAVIGKTTITEIEVDKAFKDIPDLWVKPYLEHMETMTNPSIKEE